MEFALGTFSVGGEDRFSGLVIENEVWPVHSLLAIEGTDGPQRPTVLSLLSDWPSNFVRLQALVRKRNTVREAALKITATQIHPPVDLPRQILCTGANYRKHVVDMTIDQNIGPPGLQGAELRKWAEDMMDMRARSGDPYVFSKLPSAVCAAYDDICIPNTTERADWELELGVIIGRPARNVPRERAMDFVAGYAIVNDVTARDLIPRKDYAALGTDWLASKSPPTFMPFGPWMVPAAFVRNPQELQLTLKLNGDIMQDESSGDMIFDIARQIEYISHHIQLWPGDLIATGSPAGNGTHFNRYLRAGDVIDASITGLGSQRNRCAVQDAREVTAQGFSGPAS